MVSAASLARTEPTTPEELAALKAENSRRYRSRQTTMNLVLALGASLGVVLLLVFVVVRPEGSQLADVDYPAVAVAAQESRSWPIASPELPSGWSANAAAFRTDSADRGEFWYLGLITENSGFISVQQRPDADATWVVRTLGGAASTGQLQLGGLNWAVYDQRDNPDASGNQQYALSTEVQGSTVILAGAAEEAEFAELAEAVAASFEAQE